MTHDLIVDGVRTGAALLYAERNADRGTPFRASAIGTCQRKLALMSMPGTRVAPLSARSALTLDHGTLRGKELAAAFARGCSSSALQGWHVAGLELTVKMPLPPPVAGEAWDPLLVEAIRRRFPDLPVAFDGTPAVEGHIDIAVVDPDNVLTLGDFKSAHSFSWKGQRTNAFDEGYLAQLGTYNLALAHMLSASGPEAAESPWLDPLRALAPRMGDPWILYECKDDHEMFVKVAPSDVAHDCAWQALQHTSRTLYDLVSGVVPVAPYKPNGKGELPWQCRYCPVYTTCWKGKIANVEGDPLLPKSITIRQDTP